MSRVAIFTDSASDLDPAARRGGGHHDRAAAGDLRRRRRSRPASTCRRPSSGSGWSRPMRRSRRRPRRRPASSRRPTRRPSRRAPRRSCRSTSRATLSGTIKSAQIARDMLPDREIHVVDSQGASMAEGILARHGRRARGRGSAAAEIAETLEARAADMRHLRRARHARIPAQGRPDQRHAGGHRDAAVGQADHRASSTASSTRSPRSARAPRPASASSSSSTERPIERLAILHTISPDVEAFRDEVLPRAPDGSIRRTSRSTWSGPRSGRTSGRAASARRSCIGRSAAAAGPVGPANVATRLRQRCRPVPSGRRESPASGYTPAAHESRAGHPRSVLRDPAARPVGSSGRRPEPTAVQ